MPIEFPCPTCHQQVRTPDAAAGKKGKCPTCGTVVIIPAPVVALLPSQTPTPHRTPKPAATPSKPATTPQPERPTEGIEFACPMCRQTVRTPASAAGKKGKCPHCQGVVQIPAAKASGKQSHSDPEIIDLEEMPEPVNPPRAGWVPGLTPLPADLVASLPVANPLGLPPKPAGSPFATSYGSPAATAFESPKPIRPARSDIRRRGLAWEREPSLESFGDTMNYVLGTPEQAFQEMRRDGGVGNPMMFIIIGLVIGQVATSLYYVIFLAIMLAGREGPFPLEALVIGGTLNLIGSVLGAVVAGAIGTFLTAAIFHVTLTVVGGANASYEATYRAVCFCYGSIAVMNAIPIVGPILALFYGVVVMIHGLTHTHETSGGKATAAVLLPLLLVLCCFGVILLSMLPAMVSAFGQIPR
ncbi:MAG: YIP1 family protein [Pirellulaceae bacterium]